MAEKLSDGDKETLIRLTNEYFKKVQMFTKEEMISLIMKKQQK